MFFALILFMLTVIGGVTDHFYTSLNHKIDAPYKHTLAPQAQAYRTALQRYLTANPDVSVSSVANADLEAYMPAGYVIDPHWSNLLNTDKRRFMVYVNPADATTFDPTSVKIRSLRNIEGELAEVADYSTNAGGTSFSDGQFRSFAPIWAATDSDNYWTDYSLKDTGGFSGADSLVMDSPVWIGSY